MGSLFDHYGKLIIGVIVVVLAIVVCIVIGKQFKNASSSQFNNLETIVQEQMDQVDAEVETTAPTE